MQLTSPAFDDGDPIPDEYGFQARNVNPPLRVDGVPEEAASLALLVDDPDAVDPAGKVWDHWVVWNVPPRRTEIPEDWNPADDGAVEGDNDYGDRGYGGPNPPDSEHSYRFVLYALDAELDIPPGASAADLRDAVDDHVVAEAALHGTYAP